MKIAIVNWSRRRVGGAEGYLHGIIPALSGMGHEVGFWCETDAPADREPIGLPEGAPVWCAAELGTERALRELRGWGPDVVYLHIVRDAEVEARLAGVAPTVFFAHAYYGTCVSGLKTHQAPTPTPCGRPLGPGCLLHYYPHRCGGLSPLTMLRDYGRETRRLRMVKGYEAVLTNSTHMSAEYVRNGVDPARVRTVPLPAAGGGGADPGPAPSRAEPGWSLLFLGRMDRLKGGAALLDALPGAAAELGTPLRLTLAGDGPARAEWERRAAELEVRHPELRVEFAGWISAAELEAVWARTDLLVVPSLWPEPFGLVGPEAGLRGIPAAAFASGGIPDWLEEGVNGHLAAVDPPTPRGLARAVARCLADPAHHAALRRGAVARARRFTVQRHLAALDEVFRRVARVEGVPAGGSTPG
jgi:glycosyltransferase involved in cell wall biosynthesis